MGNSIKKNRLIYGIILGLILVLLTTFMYVIDLNLFTDTWVTIVNFAIIIGLGIYTTFSNKKLLKGFITFKESFLSFIIPIIIGVAVSVLFSILLFNVIDLEAKQVINDNVIKITSEMMQKFNVPADEINKAITEIESKDQFSPIAQLQSYFYMIIVYSIIGLLLALIFKSPAPKE